MRGQQNRPLVSGNEPVSITAYFVAYIVLAVVGISIIEAPTTYEVFSQIANDLSYRITTWTQDLEDAIEKKLVGSLSVAKKPKNDREHLHHIVAQTDPRAAGARWILEYLFPHGVSIAKNLIMVKEHVHLRLHTNVYFTFVEGVIIDAFESAKPYKKDQIANVEKALDFLQAFIGALNALG